MPSDRFTASLAVQPFPAGKGDTQHQIAGGVNHPIARPLRIPATKDLNALTLLVRHGSRHEKHAADRGQAYHFISLHCRDRVQRLHNHAAAERVGDEEDFLI
jgi:hypothetical protein